jgi:hypothetical protein
MAEDNGMNNIVSGRPIQTDVEEKRLELTMVSPTQLARATFVPPAAMELEFVDGLRAVVPVESLEIPIDLILWPTIAASPHGEMMTMRKRNGDVLSIDSATLRYLADKKYAATIDESIAALHMSPTEQEEASRLSKRSLDPRWHDVGDEDDLFEW